MTDAEIAALIQERDAAFAELASWRAAFRGQTFSMSELDTMRAERDAALAEAASWHTAMRGHEAASMAELDKMRAKCERALKRSMDHALRLDALAKVIDHADADRNSLAAQVTVLRDALLAIRPGNDAGGDVAYRARWLRRKIDAALAASAQKKGGE